MKLQFIILTTAIQILSCTHAFLPPSISTKKNPQIITRPRYSHKYEYNTADQDAFRPLQKQQKRHHCALQLYATSRNTIPQEEESPSQSKSTNKPRRTISNIQKFARLPVWPAWNGALIFLLGKVFGEETAAKLEDEWGGRVCPNFFSDDIQTSPFIMLVHHRHSFAPWDPLRYFQRNFILQEGFPAHPHRGFITVTYCLKGGMVHRDSLGVKQRYGAEQAVHGKKDVQWLTTGAGVLHEEMWDVESSQDQELYQLWLNVPSRHKLDDPKVELLEEGTDMPIVVQEGDDDDEHVITKVIAGSYGSARASIETLSDVTILHVQMQPGSTWKHVMSESHRTGVIYMRRGSITVGSQRVAPHHTAYLNSYGDDLIVLNSDDDDADAGEADFLLLSGAPLEEPVAARGSMVMNAPMEIEQAYVDYQAMKMGAPWDPTLTDEEWQKHVEQYPSIYKNTR